MKLEEFFYTLPKEKIAEKPVFPRDSSKLMVCNMTTGKTTDVIFRDIVNYLKKGDVVVVNNTKVIPARLTGKRTTGGKIDVLLTKKITENKWEVIAKPSKRFKKGTEMEFKNNIKAKVVEITEEAQKIIEFQDLTTEKEIFEIGEIPVPPYVSNRRNSLSGNGWDDKAWYQTVFAKHEASIAAPTAGFHFTDKLLEAIISKGVQIAEITLHVGLGTFQPIRVEEVEAHNMLAEYFEISEKTANIINNAKKNKSRVIAVGTTVTRALESAIINGELRSKSGWTNIFIYPGYKFKVLDGLLTNFHLPNSTPLFLTCAWAGTQNILNWYQEAIKRNYRFYSYGDAMFIVL